MERLYASELRPARAGKKARVFGFVQELRFLGKLKFIVLKDKTGFMQLTLPQKAVPKQVFDLCDSLTKESCLMAEGLIQKAKQVASGAELIPSKLVVLGQAKAPTPIDTSGKIESDLSVRLDYRWLDLRDPKKMAVFEVRSKIVKFTHEFFAGQGFTNIQTPKLTKAGVESGATLFEVNYFGKKAFLSQSPQIYKQMMVIAGFDKVYEVGAVFRAEKSETTRHLTEFTGIDLEMGFIESQEEVMRVVEEYMKYLVKRMNEECQKELKLLGVKLKQPKKIPRLEMPEAKKLLAKKGKKLAPNEDLDPQAERMLCQIVKEKFKEDFVFVTLYPEEKRPFYHMRPEGKPHLTFSFDLLWNGLEIATGSQREHRYEILKKQAREKGVDLDEMKDYALIFQYGVMPHGGVGLGLDRIVEAALKLNNIREGILLPRDPVRISP